MTSAMVDNNAGIGSLRSERRFVPIPDINLIPAYQPYSNIISYLKPSPKDDAPQPIASTAHPAHVYKSEL